MQKHSLETRTLDLQPCSKTKSTTIEMRISSFRAESKKSVQYSWNSDQWHGPVDHVIPRCAAFGSMIGDLFVCVVMCMMYALASFHAMIHHEHCTTQAKREPEP